MIIPYSRVVGAKVFETKSQSILGEIDDIVFSETNLVILALTIKSPTFIKRDTKAISTTDIISLNNYAVMVGNKEAVSNLKDLVRVASAINKGFVGINQIVVTQSGRKVGRVFDYLIDSASFAITKIYTKSILKERIIPASAITDIQGHKIIIKDDYGLAEISTTLAVESI
ncbi:MAG: PRC-barrel domain-containing protein [Patescibacteria group bacterium]|jgi:uncharacterized protein YrrD